MENIVQTNDGGQIVLKQFKDNVEYAIYESIWFARDSSWMSLTITPVLPTP